MTTTYESSIKTISSSDEAAFGLFGNLNNLAKITEKPEVTGKVRNLQLSEDSCSFEADILGQISFRITEREPFKTIKFKSENSPLEFNLWIQLQQAAENHTRLKLILTAEIPAMVKFMIDKKLEEGINTVADIMAKAASS